MARFYADPASTAALLHADGFGDSVAKSLRIALQHLQLPFTTTAAML